MTSFRSEIKRRLIRMMRPVTWLNLRSTKPVSAIFGLERGLPVDRYYIEEFLGKNSDCIRGDVLEIADSSYSRKFGIEQDAQFHVLHFSNDNPHASIVGDLTDVETLPKNKFDCFICTQTYNFIYDFKKELIPVNFPKQAGHYTNYPHSHHQMSTRLPAPEISSYPVKSYITHE